MNKEEKNEALNNNKFLPELNKMVGREVTVKDIQGETYTGILRGFYINHLNIALMTKDEKIIIKGVVSIRRKRDKDDRFKKTDTDEEGLRLLR